ncbi:MAG: hypothetical protein V2A76_14480 [Planctomycetota bacterium]
MANEKYQPAAPETAPSGRTSPGPPWVVVLLVTFLLGAMVGGVSVYVLGWRLPKETQDSSTLPAPSHPPEVLRTPSPPRPAEPEVPPQRDDLTEVPAGTPAEEPAGEPESPGQAVLTLTALDPEGDRRPAAPAVVVGPSLVLAPFSAVEGARSAEVLDRNRAPRAVTGICAHDAPFDLVLLSVDAEFAGPYLLPAEAPLPEAVDLRLLGPISDANWREQTLRVSPGEIDPYTNGPRLLLEPAAPFTGALLDADGRLVGLVPEATGRAIPAHPGAPWIGQAVTPVPLETFMRSAGPGSPVSRVRWAKKLLSQRRYEEAARLLLQITAEDGRLIQEVREDLRRATLEAARKSITSGNGFGALTLVTEALQRLPEDGELWAMKGRCHGVTGGVSQAIAAFLQAGDCDPSRAESWIGEARGFLLDEINQLQAAGRPRDALRLLLEGLSSFPADGRLRMTAGELLLEKRSFSDAADLFTEAARLDATCASEARRSADQARDLAGGPGAVIIDFPAGSREIVVSATLDGSAVASFRIDPSEEMTVVPGWAARAAGYDLASARRVRFFSDPWADEVPSIQIAGLQVAGVTAARVQAVVVDGYGAPAADGVLGQSYLSLFRTALDRHLGRMVLYPR